MEILVIGGIAAGMSVAAKAKRENPKAIITVVEKENYVSFGACGLPYYLGNQFSDENEMFARTPQKIVDSGINLLLNHEVKEVDFHKKEVLIENLETTTHFNQRYDRLMIATGASPIIPKIKGVNHENVYTFTKLDEVNRLKNKIKNYHNIVIIGGGFIGVEVAEQLAALNKNITILQAEDALMSNVFDSEFSLKVKEALEDVGVDVQLNQMANDLEVENNLVKKVLTKDSEFEADAVIIAIGFKPNTAFVGSSLEMLHNGAIVTDNFGRTSIEDVFAAGDCAAVNHRLSGIQYIPLATYANKMGRIIGTNIVSDEKDWIAFQGALGSSYIKVGHHEAASTGLTESAAKAMDMNVTSTLVYANNHSNYYPNQEKIAIKLVYDAKTFVLYGAQVFGKSEAVLRIQALTTAIYAGLTTKDIGFMDFGYAPPFASTWEALNIAANTAK